MEGIFSNLYLVLQSKLKTIVSGSPAAPIFRLIDEDQGQLMDENPGLSYPCVLISFDDTTFSSLASNVQIGVVNVCFKVITDVYSSASSITPLASIQKGLKYTDLEYLMHKAIQGWSPSDETVPVVSPETQPFGWSDVFGSLDRIGPAITNKTRGDLRIREIKYSLGFEDYSTEIVIPTLPVTPSITDQFVITEL